MLRIIAGHYKSRKIETLPGLDTRPTSDRVRESVFSKMHFLLPDARVLDLFAGSGAIGIEAVSRGAKEVIMADLSRESCGVIRKNLTTLSVRNAQVINQDYKNVLKSLSGQHFDFIYLDPPYQDIRMDDVFDEISRSGIRFGMLAAECRDLPGTMPIGARSSDVRKYGKTYVIFYEGEGKEE